MSRQSLKDDCPNSEEGIPIPVGDVLDLHAFCPKDIAPLVEEYLQECLRHGIGEVRLIHGKGKGVQRAQVHQLLNRLHFVLSYRDAPPELGHWGATLVRLCPSQKNELKEQH
jgi:dsDNA-specific endonuclease/ATPase MutS2